MRVLLAVRRPRLIWWVVTWCTLVGVQILAAVLPGAKPWWSSPISLFVIVVVAASGCVVTAVAVLVMARREDLAELGLIGSFTITVSLLPLVHGLTIPGVWFGSNQATSSSVFWALPLASVIVLPLVAPMSRWSRWSTRRWRVFVLAHVCVVTAVSISLLLWPSMLPVPEMRSGISVLVAVASLAVCFALSARQLRLSWISGSAQPFLVSVGFAFVGVSSLVWLAREPFTPGFWLAHAFDIAGVFLVAIGAIVAFRQRAGLAQIVRPLTVHTPLAAFELGLDPLVHSFVASLEAKDPITRNHVVRSAQLAMVVGEELGVSAGDLHLLGLGALLHDIGKLAVPTEIINKPGRLDDAEFTVMRGHAAAGEALVRRSIVLAPIGPIVRGHHERIDGQGYPDRLVGDGIPEMARIVSVCDAFDAMSNSRQYREAMGADRAIAVLREHSGSQWDSRIVEALVAVLRRAPRIESALEEVGRSPATNVPEWEACGCFDVVPVEVASYAGSVVGSATS